VLCLKSWNRDVAIRFRHGVEAERPEHENQKSPPDSATAPSHDTHYRRFLWAVVVAIVFDTTQTAMRGRLFSPVYYLPFVGQYALLAIISISTRNELLRRIIAWWFLISIAAWSLVVRRFLE